VNQDGKEVVTGTAEVIAPTIKVELKTPTLPKITIAGLE
jgi:hypothetical protein